MDKPLSRVDTAALQTALTTAEEHLRQALTAVEPHLVALTDKERASVVRPPLRFPEAGRSMARVASDWPEMAGRASFDAAAVTEDLDNAAALSELSDLVDRLQALVEDSRLLWLAEAYLPSLALYDIAKAGAKYDGKLQALVDPMADVFASRRRKARE
jgi:hypothetical protein